MSLWIHIGAFAVNKYALPATTDYAGSTERGGVQVLGKIFGCHSCGM